MRTSTVGIASGVLVLSSLLFAIPSQASAAHIPASANPQPLVVEGAEIAAPCGDFYTELGYICDTDTSPGPNAVLIHIKLRDHGHSIDFQLNARDTSQNSIDVNTGDRDSKNIWIDPSKYSSVGIALAANIAQAVTLPLSNDGNNQYQCYYEDKAGTLAVASVGAACTPN